MVAFDLTRVLRAFADGGVDFIVVGGLAATFNGAIYNTQDVDLVHSRTPENVERILDLLGTIGPGLDYDNLLPHSELMEIELGLTVRVLNLETLITLKEQAGRQRPRGASPSPRCIKYPKKG
jgi:predicted nucleotidyltransferase